MTAHMSGPLRALPSNLGCAGGVALYHNPPGSPATSLATGWPRRAADLPRACHRTRPKTCHELVATPQTCLLLAADLPQASHKTCRNTSPCHRLATRLATGVGGGEVRCAGLSPEKERSGLGVAHKSACFAHQFWPRSRRLRIRSASSRRALARAATWLKSEPKSRAEPRAPLFGPQSG